MQPRGPMILRTAQTEERIAQLEQAVARIMRHLKLDDDDDHEDVPLPGVQPPDRSDADSGTVGPAAAELSQLRGVGLEGEDEPRVSSARNRGKRSR